MTAVTQDDAVSGHLFPATAWLLIKACSPAGLAGFCCGRCHRHPGPVEPLSPTQGLHGGCSPLPSAIVHWSRRLHHWSAEGQTNAECPANCPTIVNGNPPCSKYVASKPNCCCQTSSSVPVQNPATACRFVQGSAEPVLNFRISCFLSCIQCHVF